MRTCYNDNYYQGEDKDTSSISIPKGEGVMITIQINKQITNYIKA